MDQYDDISSRHTSPPPLAPELDLLIGDAGSVISMRQLRSAVAEIFRALNETLRDEKGKASECLQRAEALLEIVEQPAAPASSIGPQGLAPWQIRRVLTHVNSNLDTTIRNRDLAAVARLCESHFNVAFRKSVGQSPHEYIIRRRMERAQGLMLSTDKALSEIAAECGLADQPHFTRLFRRIVGESPAAWRRARANPESDGRSGRSHKASPNSPRINLTALPRTQSSHTALRQPRANAECSSAKAVHIL
jgi:AraC-like DNA-binding protein